MLCNQMSAGAAVFEIVELQVTAGDRVGFETALLRCGSKAELARHPAPQRRLTICLPRSTAPGILPTSTAPSWLALNAPPRALRAASLPVCLIKVLSSTDGMVFMSASSNVSSAIRCEPSPHRRTWQRKRSAQEPRP